MNVRSQDVGPLIDTWQSTAPEAYTAPGMLPGPGLADWMLKQLQTSGGLKLTRSADDRIYDHAVAWLEAEGVNVGRELERADRAEEAGRHRTRAAADRARDAAFALKDAERALLAESRGFNAGATGFTSARLAEARARAAGLHAALVAACYDDPDLARTVRRSVA